MRCRCSATRFLTCRLPTEVPRARLVDLPLPDDDVTATREADAEEIVDAELVSDEEPARG